MEAVDQLAGAGQVPAAHKARSLALASKPVRTGSDFAALMSALMSDLIEGNVSPGVGNAVCNAGGKLLKVVELQYKFGVDGGNGGKKTLQLSD
jgi:hypothetical protein